MSNSTVGSKDFLNAVYRELKFETGAGHFQLQDPSIVPDLGQSSWIKQARLLGADSIFFIGEYPTVLFFDLNVSPSTDTKEIEDKIRELHIKVWNTSLIPLFFVAMPGEIRIYSAYETPVEDIDKWCAEKRWLERIETITQLLQIWEFSRPEVESGHLFDIRSSDFDRNNRVDQWLLKNLHLLRQRLEGQNREKREHAHALIGRSIFIRYLEDRDVLVEGYFLDKTISRNGIYHCYTDVLSSKEDTYNLFRKLGKDFNGDLFPLKGEEENAIDEDDLCVLGDFLKGRTMENQPDLLFWAYRFNIIPTELISSIYEEFYHEFGGEEDQGTHYTPMTLVNLVLTETLTPERLNAEARILDCACGSGIFLVEAFKRIVYHECRRQNIGPTELTREQLTKFLTERIIGIDLNHAAIQVAAFSLYLAFLDFREPPDIREHKGLPRLVYDPAESQSGKTLFCCNAFTLSQSERVRIQNRLEEKRVYKGRIYDANICNQPVLPFDENSFEVIIGNPPWGSIKSEDDQLPVNWCRVFRYPVGDKELSQCFLWRAGHLLKPGGEIGLLVSTGILFKHQEKSKEFRQLWLKRNCIRALYNFAHVRNVFFRKQRKEAIAPFAAVFYKPAKENYSMKNKLIYISAKQNALIKQLQAVVMDKADLKQVRQEDVLANDWLWKTYIWGTHIDVDLIGELKSCHKSLGDMVTEYGMGYSERSAINKKSTDDLGVEFELETKAFNRKAEFSELVKPIIKRQIHRIRNPEIYKGPRILVKRGVSKSGNKLGEIQARLAYEPFAFRNSIFGFRLDKLNIDDHQILLGIVMSSLAKYYYFMTCSTWGFWHDEIHESEHLSLPINLNDETVLRSRVLEVVKQITREHGINALFELETREWRLAQDKLDDAIFDLYGLSKGQRDLVRDLCDVTLDYYYNGNKSVAVRPPTSRHLEEYRDAFLEVWQDRLASKNKELECRIYAPRGGLLVGMALDLKELGKGAIHRPITDNEEWQSWFTRLSKLVREEWMRGIYIDRTIKELTGSSMLLVKRAERYRWTKSQARTDAQELLTEVFKLEWESVKR